MGHFIVQQRLTQYHKATRKGKQSMESSGDTNIVTDDKNEHDYRENDKR